MTLAGVAMIVVLVVAALVWTARVISIGLRDARDLASKVAIPHPRSSKEWPELNIDEVVCEPDRGDHLLVIVRWPAHPLVRTLMVLETPANSAAHRKLTHWRDAGSSISPMGLDDDWVSLRRRRSAEHVEARVVAETPWGP